MIEEIRTGILSASYNQLLDRIMLSLTFLQLFVYYKSFIHQFIIGRRRPYLETLVNKRHVKERVGFKLT